MSKRKLAILAIDDTIAQFFQRELYLVFKQSLEIKYYTLTSTPLPNIYEADLIIYTDPSILIDFMPYIQVNCPVIMMKRTLSKEAMGQLHEIPDGSRCLVANINSFMANETLATIYQLGFKYLRLYPYYEGKSYHQNLFDYIITPEDYDYLKTLDYPRVIIGNRIFDINTILDILSVLDMSSDESENIIMHYSSKIPQMWKGVTYALQNKRILSSQWKILLNELSIGVIVVDDKNRISLVNKPILDIFGNDFSVYDNQPLENLLDLDRVFEPLLQDDIQDELFYFSHHKLILSIKKVVFNRIYYGKIILLRTYEDVLQVQQKIHQKLIGKGYYSKHTFQDIIGHDPSILDCIDLSKKVAHSQSAILITGDSGTGKELLAGAIHNYSKRSSYPYVAINCATIPHQLLESELFGYEEGAFTGAKKGGKIGLFESAHEGTLFLDEISEIPLQLQARLLRALQEKEIMKVGGDKLIRVDTRIIAATNKDLLEMVGQGLFRKDLYFRLNTFQIDLPPLKERKKDIELLIQHFLKFYPGTQKCTALFMHFAMNYSWPGNVRELQNVLEYMTTVSNKPLSLDHLPNYMKAKSHLLFQINQPSIMSYHIFILYLVWLANQKNRPAGRRTLQEQFSKKYYPISEIEMRQNIDLLIEKGLLQIKGGPKGCVVLPKGLQILEDLHFQIT